MRVNESEIRILQELARGPLDTSRPCLETLAKTLAPVVPDAQVLHVRRRANDASPGERVDHELLEGDPCGDTYLLAEASAESALVLVRPAGSPLLDPRQRSLLRLAARWLPAWAQPGSLEPEVLPPRGSAVWIDAQGNVVREDEVATRLLAQVEEATSLLQALFRERSEAGARGHVERTAEAGEHGVMLLRAEAQLADGTCLVTLELLEPGSEAMFRARTQSLTARETQIARLVQDSWGNKGIAQQLSLSPATVNMYLGKIYKKLGVKNRTELTRYLSGIL